MHKGRILLGWQEASPPHSGAQGWEGSPEQSQVTPGCDRTLVLEEQGQRILEGSMAGVHEGELAGPVPSLSGGFLAALGLATGGQQEGTALGSGLVCLGSQTRLSSPGGQDWLQREGGERGGSGSVPASFGGGPGFNRPSS